MPSPELMDVGPDAYLSMGLTAENVATRFGVSRDDQDAFSVESHRRALAAQAEGRFDQEIVPVEVTHRLPGPDGKVIEKTFLHAVDEGPRAGTTMEVLAGLKPVFRKDGSVTAGNSSQTSDGAGAVVVMSGEKAASLGLQPMGRFVSFAAAGVDPSVMGIGPAVAIPKALRIAGLSLEQIDLIELNEAFASQAVYVMRTLRLDPGKVNVNGGAIALGHPLGMSGARLVTMLVHELARRGGRYGLATMCIGVGQGIATVMERIDG